MSVYVTLDSDVAPLNPTPSLFREGLEPSVMMPSVPCQAEDFTAAATILTMLR